MDLSIGFLVVVLVIGFLILLGAGLGKEEVLIKDLIRNHTKALAIKRAQLVVVDAYGTKTFAKWDKEKRYFIERVVRPRFKIHHAETTIQTWIDEIIDQYQSTPGYATSPLNVSIEALSPQEYEQHCAGLLRGMGWNARVTKASGDQGVDIVAEKGGRRVVIQCKRYSKPVGNKAVQEVIAARQFEDAQLGAVVTNAPFTPSAHALAQKSGVLLLHHSELDRLN